MLTFAKDSHFHFHLSNNSDILAVNLPSDDNCAPKTQQLGCYEATAMNDADHSITSLLLLMELILFKLNLQFL